jgi:hypothetical protein
MILFDFGGNVSVDLNKIEAIELDKSIEFPVVFAIGVSGNRYMVPLGKETEFFTKIQQLERNSEQNPQRVVL